jgi:thioredoxin reductase (NADPH)
MAAQFTLLSREYCHLCHDMLEELRLMQARFSFGLEVIDVDGDVRRRELLWGMGSGPLGRK